MIPKDAHLNSADVDAFIARLRSAHGYRSQEGAEGKPFAGCARWPSLWYHWRQAQAIWRGYRLARRGQLDGAQWLRLSLFYLETVERCGGTVDVSGLEHLAQTGGRTVIVSNHMSTLETCLLPCLILPFSLPVFVIKRSLLRYPFFGPLMGALKHIAVDRVQPRDDLKEVLVQGSALLAEGAGVVLFPQSTRDAVFDPAAFNTLGVKLGRHAGVPVVPLALRTDFLQNGRWLKDLGRVCPSIPVRVQFGPPLTVSGNGRTAHAEVVRFITARLREWGAQLKRQENPG